MSDALSFAPIQSWEIEKLVPYEDNNKKHPESQVSALSVLLNEDGMTDPILVEEDGTIIAGHGRRLAALKLGWTHVPVRVAVGVSKAQARKLRIAVNKIASNEYDTDALARELAALSALDIDLSNIGLSAKEMTLMLDDVGELDLGAITSDVVADVEKHEDDVREAADKAETSSVPVSKAFGFKSVPVGAQRTITRFMGVIEDSHGKTGLEALLAHMEEVVSGV